MQRLVSVFPKVIGNKFNIISINLIIRNNWENIISPQFIHLMKFKNALISGINDELELNVIVDVIGSAIIFVKNQSPIIMSSIKLLTGVENVNIKYHQVLIFNSTN